MGHSHIFELMLPLILEARLKRHQDPDLNGVPKAVLDDLGLSASDIRALAKRPRKPGILERVMQVKNQLAQSFVQEAQCCPA